ncbi:MAG: hypothetical protein M3R38_19335 [Actinomycetota bacterium]|nr:hypothetical protein [Actinomycetota bacterium]
MTGVLEGTGLGDNPGYEDPSYGLLDESSGVLVVLEGGVYDLSAHLGDRVTADGSLTPASPPGADFPFLVAEEGAGGERIVGTDGPDDLRGTRVDDLLAATGTTTCGASTAPTCSRARPARTRCTVDRATMPCARPTKSRPWRSPDAPASRDLLYGGEGDDFVDAAHAAGAFDAVYCGPGDDLVEACAEDFVADDCEEAVRF